MALWRKLGVLGVALSVLDVVSGLTGQDGVAETATEVAMLASVLGAHGPPLQPAAASKPAGGSNAAPAAGKLPDALADLFR